MIMMRRLDHRWVSAVTSLFLVGLAARVCAPVDGAADPPYWDLVRKLGDVSFSTREHAEQQLLQIGLPAKLALERGMRDQDLEIRLAAQRILIRALQCDFDASVKAFVEGRENVSAERFPGWRKFRQRIDDDTSARHLYVEMIRAESALLTALEYDDPDLFKQFTDRLQRLTTNMGQAGVIRATVSGPALATWLFVGAELADQATDRERRQQLGTFTRWLLYGDAGALPAVIQTSRPALIRQLLAQWITSSMKGDDGTQAGNAMQLVLKYDLAEQGVKLAREVLEPSAGPDSAARIQVSAKPYAAIVLARFGTGDDARYLVPHLNDTHVFHTWSNPQLQPDPITIQVRDVMLALLLRMRGHSPEACGFGLLEPFPETLYRIWTYGFLNDRNRDETFARWRETAEGGGGTPEAPLPPGGQPRAGEVGE